MRSNFTRSVAIWWVVCVCWVHACLKFDLHVRLGCVGLLSFPMAVGSRNWASPLWTSVVHGCVVMGSHLSSGERGCFGYREGPHRLPVGPCLRGRDA